MILKLNLGKELLLKSERVFAGILASYWRCRQRLLYRPSGQRPA